MMERALTIFIILFYFNLSFGQESVYLDIDGKSIDENSFLSKWRNSNNMLSRWDYIGHNKKRYATLRNNMYENGISDYNLIKTELEKIINRKIQDSVTIIISYKHKDDLCTLKRYNNWSRAQINSRKRWLKPILKELNDKNIFYVWLFESGIKLNTKKGHKDEFFFQDRENFFREKIFGSETLCGSVSAIKSNGQILVRNGEGSLRYMMKNIEPEEWNQFFKKN